ncbi:MAG: AAA family ATPase, partial [Candidatus Dormibacteraceae bacterium]
IIEPRIKGVEILIYEGRPVLHVDFGSRLPLPLPLLGAGMTAFVDCIMLFQDAAGGVILLDEVEGGVYYRALPALWQRLGELAERFNVQLFATTHSRECLLAAHQSLGKRPGLVNLLRLSPSQDNSEKTEVVAYDSELLAAALLKHEAFDDLFTFLKDLPEGARSN